MGIFGNYAIIVKEDSQAGKANPDKALLGLVICCGLENLWMLTLLYYRF